MTVKNEPTAPPPLAPEARDALLRATEALRQSQLELRALANSMPQLSWIAEQDGTVVWYNQRWYDYTGTTPEQMSGDGWKRAYAPDCIGALEAHWAQSRRHGTPFELEVPIRGAGGEYRWFLMRANPVHGPDGNVLRWFGTSTDVDQVKRAQKALRDETAILELFNHTGMMLASQRDLGLLLQEITDAATRITGARFGAFYHNPNSAGEAMVPHTLSSGATDAFSQFAQPRATALFDPAMRTQGTVRCDDVLTDPRYGGNAPRHDMPHDLSLVRSYLAVPVALRSGVVIGCLIFGHPQPGIFTERTERIIAGVAAQAAVAIDNARLCEASQRAAEEREVLLDSERQARAEAERTSHLKDEFLATLSHELRTPLTAILGWAQVLRRGSRDEAAMHRGLQTIERNARAQSRLIEDLLDMGSITSGRVKLEMQPLAPAMIAAAAIESVRAAAEAKQIRIEQDFAIAPGMVSGDANRLQQVLWNLLSNALKFTPHGGTVTVGVRRDGDDIAISVRDNGIGIAPGFLDHVFERFRQADASTTRQHGGLGLGLAIVKHLVEQHGGTISASSGGDGQGACFTLRLPRQDARSATPAAPAPAVNHAAAHDLRGLRVLVVDNEVEARELIKRILAGCNAEVLTAATATEAMDLLQHERPDLMVSDLGMQEVDGDGLLDRVRALGPARGGDLPAIALTAFARSEERIKALSSGFLAYIAKPIEPGELIAKVAAMGATRRHA